MLSADFAISSTLATPATARYGCRVTDNESLQAVVRHCGERSIPIRWLGEGSNIIPAPHIEGCVVQLVMQGVEVIAESASSVSVRAAAGLNWHQFLTQCLQQGWYGLENLALIPGSVGAVPVQNVGAYGIEVSDFISRVHVVDLSGESMQMKNSECNFSYRNSIFKQRTDLAITAVEFELNKTSSPHLEYPDVQAWFERHNTVAVSAQALFDAVVSIRQAKLPDPNEYPNAGSFFKNPLLEPEHATQLRGRFTQLRLFDDSSGLTKLSAAQLIDLAGGKNIGNPAVYCWPRQPLVVINEGGVDANQVLAFAARLQDLVVDTFAISLEIEPQIWR